MATVNSLTLLSGGEGTQPDILQAKMGIVPSMSKWDFFALQGKMFNCHEATLGTALTGQAAGAIALTAPAIRFTVPSGTTVFPRKFAFSLVTAAGTVNKIILAYTDTDTYTSGGTAMSSYIQNVRTNKLSNGSTVPSTAVTNAYYCSGSAITEGAITNPRVIADHYEGIAFQAAAEPVRTNREIIIDDLIPIVGPASFLVYMAATTTALTYLFSLTWAEVSTSVV